MTGPTPEPTTITITTEMWDEIQAGWHRTVRSLVTLVVVTVLAVGAFAGFVAWRSYQSQARQECITRHQAIGLGDLANALKGTPAAPARNKKLTTSADELAKLRDVGQTCG